MLTREEKPAAGCKETPGRPVISARCSCNSNITSSAPCESSTGASGWRLAKPVMRATFSFRRELYFIVHDPKGYMPRSIE